MKMGFELNMQQTQKLVMTPELQQAIAILQLPTQELVEYIEEQLIENPILELKDDSESDVPAEENKDDLQQEEKFDIDWQEYFQDESDLGYPRHSKETKESVAYENFVGEAPTLHDHLMMQYNLIAADEDKEIGEFIIGNLDDNGYLCTSIDDIIKHLKVSRKKAEKALKNVQSLEPAGVGARDLRECLLLQLKSRGIDDAVIKCLVENHLHDLGDGKINKIAKKESLNVHDVQQFVDLIKTLDPKPGRWFASGNDVRYIVPDVVVEKIDGKYVVLVNDVYTPKLGINPVYRSLMKKN
jgi:RNA polymerase sigma-54 factor